MKKICLFLLFMALSSNIAISSAESDYTPLVREGVEWGYTVTSWFPPCVEYFRVQMKGDTIIENKSYKKYYQYQTAELDTAKTKPIAFLREENKKVYMLRNAYVESIYYPAGGYMGYGYERLLYDFGLSVGGTFNIEGSFPNFLEIESINDITIGGKLRKEYDAKGKFIDKDFLSYDCSFIEGIGSKNYGEMAFPYPPLPTGVGTNNGGVLNFERVVGGDIVYKREDFDDHDPTIKPSEKNEYTPLVREGVEWGYILKSTTEPTYYRVQMKGDTIISGKSYKKYYQYQTKELDTTKAKPIAFLREENKKVYMLRNVDVESLYTLYGDWGINHESLLYDFGLNLGDTFDFGPQGEFVINSIQNNVPIGGKVRKIFYVLNSYFDFHFIEGIGSACYGEMAFPYPSIPAGEDKNSVGILNFERIVGGDIVYESENYDANDPTIKPESVTKVAGKKGNPVKAVQSGDKVTVSAEGCESVELIDLNGSVIARGAADGNSTVTLPTGNLTPGVYVVVATTASGIGTQKVVIR